MRISKKAEYALRALAILATRAPSRPIQIQDLAESGRIPLKFLEQILLILRRADILLSKRGLGGGYRLSRPAASITLAEVIQLLDGPGPPTDAPRPGSFPGSDTGNGPGSRGLEETMKELDVLVHGFLASQTIATLLQREEPASGHFEI